MDLTKGLKVLDKNTLGIATDEMVDRLRELLGEHLFSIFLYGSYARGNQNEESDIDVAMITDQKLTVEMDDKIADLVMDLDLKYDTVFSIVDLQKDVFDDWIDVLPYYRNIRDEGVVLWQR